MNIAVIGCGNMASAVVLNMHKQFSELKFFTFTPSFTRAKTLADATNSLAVKSLEEFDNIDINYWILGCKPQQIKDLAKELNGKLKGKKIVSMLAATQVNKLKELFGTNDIIRIMPNTPVKYSKGITLFFSENTIDKSFRDSVFKHMSAGSKVFNMDSEKQLDDVTVFTGSGPAYVFYLAQTLEDKLKTLNIPSDISREMINSLFTGSSSLMENSKETLPELVDQVTSKAGVTIEAINIYKASELDKITSKAIDAALERTDQIVQELK